MADESEDRIRERAYAIWDAKGRPTDRDVENWLDAERDLAVEEGAAEAAVDDPVSAAERTSGPDETVETISANPKPSIETLTQPAPEPVEAES